MSQGGQPQVSEPETQSISGFGGWQFAHAACIWCLLKWKKRHSEEICVPASGEKLIYT